MDSRTNEQIREHYDVEHSIADRLRESKPEERLELYQWAYDELFSRVPHHPMLTPRSEAQVREYVDKELAILGPMIDGSTVFAEIGPGDCALSMEVAKLVAKVIAIDVSREITSRIDAPANFELILSDGTSIPVPDESLDVVYSNQLMEHLHPDDSMRQLENIFRKLKPGGSYVCVTPNRLSGPHDISRDFDPVATGLHLREFTLTELDEIFKQAGFRSRRAIVRVSRTALFLPVFPFRSAESFLGLFSHRWRKLMTFNRVVRYLLGVKLVGIK